MHLRLLLGCGCQVRFSIRLEEISSSLSQVPPFPPLSIRNYLLIISSVFLLIHIFCPSHSSREMAAVWSLQTNPFRGTERWPLSLSPVLLVALSPPWNQRGFPGLKTRKKQNGNEFYQPVDKRNSPSQSGLHFGNEASTVFLQSPLASCLQINWRCNHNLPGWILAHHFETAKLERDFSWCKVSWSSSGSQQDEYWIHHIPHSACSVSQIYCWHNSTFRDGTADHIF